MKWALLPVVLLCFVWLPGAANAGGEAELRPAGAPLSLALDSGPSWSPDGTRIGFMRLALGFGTVSANGSDERVIDDSITAAVLSPDGEWFAFVSSSRDPTGIWTSRADGSEARFLVQGYSPVWSPDSRRIAFRAPGGADSALWVIDRDGGGRQQLAPSGADPTWSPDGEWIAFSTGTSQPAIAADLFVVSSSGGAARGLVQSPGGQIAPRWSPDGTLIAYLELSGQPPGSSARPAVVRPDGSGLRVPSDERNAGRLAWMPDSRSLVFDSADGSPAADPSGVYLLDVESGRTTLVVAGGYDPEPSPDGTRIAFAAKRDCYVFYQRQGIYVVGIDGKQLKRLTNHCRLVGTAGPDELRSSVYPELLLGLGGDDRLYALGGDRLEGGDGDDLLVGGYAAGDRLRGGAGDDVLLGRSGFDVLTGGPGRDRIEGGRGRDRIFARDGQRDTIDCGTMLNGQVREHGDRVWADFHDVVSRDCDKVYFPRLG